MAAGDHAWMQDAACKERPDLDWFDLDCYLHAVLAVCAVCPVGDACLEYAITHQLRDGVWGGEWGYRLEHAATVRGRARGGHHGQG